MSEQTGQIYATSAKMPQERKSRSNARAPDSTTTSRWRFGRSTANLHEPARSASIVSKTPSMTPSRKLERVSSKMSLFNLFSRPKVERARGHTEVGLAVPMRPQTPPQPSAHVSIPKSSLRQNPSPPAQQTMRARSSQMFRQSMRPMAPYKEFGNWDPPPLFQAFPQSLKHATVQACVFPPEVLMRTQSQRQQAESLREKMDTARELATITENGPETKKLEKTHKRLMSNSVLNPPTPELVNKIYILVTAGYVLQYAGDGTFDRLPEKVLQLGKESAAFACDLIPGKHWVLQISSHATDDGTFETGPKNSLLARLRTQNATIRKSATSFLLVLESAEEMDEWMTTVRKEIDNLGGMRAKDDYARASSSTDDSAGKVSSEQTSHRYRVTRDPHGVSRIAPPIEPHNTASPKVITPDWETNGDEQNASSADSSSGQTGRYANGRPSVEMSSVASTPVSQHQIQLDQLRGRSRFSFMSTATSASGAGTRNTSRDSSPAPQSPLKEEFASAGENEPFRSAMSLRSFHMNPSNSMSSRRRSMQPLPITNEDSQSAVKTPPKSKRHSFYSPASPTVPELGKPFAVAPTVPAKEETNNIEVAPSNARHVADVARSSPPQVKTDVSAQAEGEDAIPIREDSPVRFNAHIYSSPPRRDVISLPPKDPAPLPLPPAQRRQSIIRASPSPTSAPAPMYASTKVDPKARRRTSGSPKPFLRPLPVRPQAQHGDSTTILTRRQSSLTPTSVPAPLLLGTNGTRSVTAPVRPPSAASNMTPTSSPHGLNSASRDSQALRRPASVQIRAADPAPFLSSRPVRAIASTPSFVPGRRMSNAPPPSLSHLTPSIDALRQQALAQHIDQKIIAPRRSMAALGLPPPAPPPNMPLPAPPRDVSSPTPPPNMPLPVPPRNVPSPTPLRNVTSPTPPPNMPLPTPPTGMMGLGMPPPPPNVPLPPTPPDVASMAAAL
jgi:hypothetical protein